MTKTKICGLRRDDDVHYVNGLMPDYAGFVFAESSRRVGIDKARSMSELMNRRIRRVGIFVDEEMECIMDAVYSCRLNIIQLCGHESGKSMHILRSSLDHDGYTEVRIWKSIGIAVNGISQDRDHVKMLYEGKLLEAGSAPDAFVLDSSVPGRHGGTGKAFDWSIAAGISSNYSAVLAGGLNAENVTGAILAVRPFCVDVSSGVETGGCKDFGKMAAFMEAVRRTDMYMDLNTDKAMDAYKAMGTDKVPSDLVRGGV